MLNRLSSFGLLGTPAPLIFLMLLADLPSQNAPGAPAPKSKPYALLYLPKKRNLYETSRYRRSQMALVKTNHTTVPFVLFWGIRSLENADLPSLPKKGKGGENRFNNAEDVVWLEQHLQIEYLDGTGVLRIALDAGNPREQALLVNAIVHAYFRLEVSREKQDLERQLEVAQRLMKATQAVYETVKGAEKKKQEQRLADVKAGIKRVEDELRTLPQLLDLAEVPPE